VRIFIYGLEFFVPLVIHIPKEVFKHADFKTLDFMEEVGAKVGAGTLVRIGF